MRSMVGEAKISKLFLIRSLPHFAAPTEMDLFGQALGRARP